MTRVNIYIEDREGGRYFVKVESSFPNQRKGEAFMVGIEAALDKVREFCREFGVDDAKALPMMRPMLQAEIDRAQAAQEAAGDVESAKEWRDGALGALNATSIMTFDVDDMPPSEIARRKPGRPRKEAPGDGFTSPV